MPDEDNGGKVRDELREQMTGVTREYSDLIDELKTKLDLAMKCVLNVGLTFPNPDRYPEVAAQYVADLRKFHSKIDEAFERYTSKAAGRIADRITELADEVSEDSPARKLVDAAVDAAVDASLSALDGISDELRSFVSDETRAVSAPGHKLGCVVVTRDEPTAIISIRQNHDGDTTLRFCCPERPNRTPVEDRESLIGAFVEAGAAELVPGFLKAIDEDGPGSWHPVEHGYAVHYTVDV